MSKKATKSVEERIAKRLLEGKGIGEGGIIFNGLEIRQVEGGKKQTTPKRTKETEAVEAELARSEAGAEGVADTTGTAGTSTATGGGSRRATPSTGNTPAPGTGTTSGED